MKKGKLLTSHRYDQLPLLRSRPGDSLGAGCVRLARGKVKAASIEKATIWSNNSCSVIFVQTLKNRYPWTMQWNKSQLSTDPIWL